MIRILAAASLVALAGTATFAQEGDPNTMKCVEFMALSAEGMAQVSRQVSINGGGPNEVNADIVRKLENTCPTNPEMTVAEAAGQS